MSSLLKMAGNSLGLTAASHVEIGTRGRLHGAQEEEGKTKLGIPLL